MAQAMIDRFKRMHSYEILIFMVMVILLALCIVISGIITLHINESTPQNQIFDGVTTVESDVFDT